MGTVSGIVVEGLIEAARNLGLCDEELYAVVGWQGGAPEGLDLWRLRLPSQRFGLLWEAMVAASGEPQLALQVASSAQIGQLGLLGYAMMSSSTLGDALHQMIRAKRLLNDDAVLLHDLGPRVAVRYELLCPDMPGATYILEHACVALVGMCRWLSGAALVPDAVWSTAGPPPYAAQLDALLGAPVCYGQPYDACIYPQAAMELPLMGANAQLHQQFAGQLQQQLDALERSLSWSKRVALCLEEAWPPMELPSLAAVAARLHCSTRSLQRHLRHEGSSFRDLLQRARLEKARRWLLEPSLTIDEVACRVGFSEASTFTRAFRQWTDQTPGAFRSQWLP